jgi:hypothetical protein
MLPRTYNDRSTRWEVRFDGEPIGRVEEKKIGRSSSLFFVAFVFVDGVTINLELSTDFEERCQSILEAWREPASNVHVRSVLRLPDQEWR